MTNNLIITLKIEDGIQLFLDEKRKQFYPAYCNYVPAHLTFFHSAPHHNLFLDSLEKIADHKEILCKLTAVLPFKNGMAYSVTNEYLQAAHAELQHNFLNEFSGKDRKIWKPHVTIQNKVTAFKAQKSYHQLLQDFKAFDFIAEGFNTYVYSKNKWHFNFFLPFQKL